MYGDEDIKLEEKGTKEERNKEGRLVDQEGQKCKNGGREERERKVKEKERKRDSLRRMGEWERQECITVTWERWLQTIPTLKVLVIVASVLEDLGLTTNEFKFSFF